jgi:hypothetical protein
MITKIDTDLKGALKKYFGFNDFKGKQELVNNKNFPTHLLHLLPIDRQTAAAMLMKREDLPLDIIEAIHEEYKGYATQEDEYIDGSTLLVLQSLVGHPNVTEEMLNYYSFSPHTNFVSLWRTSSV